MISPQSFTRSIVEMNFRSLNPAWRIPADNIPSIKNSGSINLQCRSIVISRTPGTFRLALLVYNPEYLQ